MLEFGAQSDFLRHVETDADAKHRIDAAVRRAICGRGRAAGGRGTDAQVGIRKAQLAECSDTVLMNRHCSGGGNAEGIGLPLAATRARGTAELDGLTSQLAYLKSQVAESTLSIYVSTDRTGITAGLRSWGELMRQGLHGFLSSVQSAITWLFIALPWLAMMTALAAGKGNRCFIIGEPVANWQDMDLTKERVELTIDGNKIQSSVGGHPDPRPANLVVWQANHLNNRGAMLKKGDVIATGSVVKGGHPAVAGQRAVATYGNWGKVEMSFR